MSQGRRPNRILSSSCKDDEDGALMAVQVFSLPSQRNSSSRSPKTNPLGATIRLVYSSGSMNRTSFRVRRDQMRICALSGLPLGTNTEYRADQRVSISGRSDALNLNMRAPGGKAGIRGRETLLEKGYRSPAPPPFPIFSTGGEAAPHLFQKPC